MKFSLFALATLALSAVVSAGADVSCAEKHAASKGQSCAVFSSKYHITVKQLQTLNSGLGSNGKDCKNLIPGKSYCTKATSPKVDSPNKSTPKKSDGDKKSNDDKNKETISKSSENEAKQSTVNTNGASHIAARAIAECKKYHVVKAGDTCETIAKQYSIPEAQFTELNKKDSKDSAIPCTKLVSGKRYCVAH
ncbi:hypothetical protein J3Q64DRAFT_1768190 [Phycomyces blakesleeanus]|uniref:Secreted LysM domain-containing protein n=2 Tax=Phycomyces blakesleeanus TaxID=4837 RepID=A0A167JEP3_PHYB8|nr:secreted LysM domain-containing protein [Phycomyces blakesleeanus NRRL 1555(-)]XP_018283887.1 hypothetical protein PHYBLDRAFT_153104 [Phycomyces blakesleeanus NRRL 1555(-)]OAD65843.1 secreted LysM domain-containing protein [Phycomyces blakesleeanus NRRL 1555(-)]OAD65847.1 hypothetical protein PHYBLDRAFT_153104 [Phycomyces blakesleeanus NRRL 1555(-)]|eukprot:XP_018283883.1 secreted LysM domain-containing protein [Phycomyces blakesleeanus NRRL 1555(-)]